MSELIQHNDNRATIRWKLLTGASALALTAYVASSALANADDTDRPTLWIEFGGQMETPQGMSAPFTPPFMSAITPRPDVYSDVSFTGEQKQARFSFGEEARITFQPEDSAWNFSAGIRYGRSHANRHTHKQLPAAPVPYSVNFTFFGTPYTYVGTKYFQSSALADTQTQNSERHAILDFTAGKDVGLGLFGRDGTSTINGGVRFASFTANSSALISARPSINPRTTIISYYGGYLHLPVFRPTFHQYTMSAHAARSFKGIGPTLSWEASAAIAGNKQDGELTFDWGVNVALLFGKQKAKVQHSTQAYQHTGHNGYPLLYRHAPAATTRSRSVTVPNIGGFAGLSLKWTNAKISFGYRVDSFFNAMDTGIDTAKKSNVSFYGPFASISIGLGN